MYALDVRRGLQFDAFVVRRQIVDVGDEAVKPAERGRLERARVLVKEGQVLAAVFAVGGAADREQPGFGKEFLDQAVDRHSLRRAAEGRELRKEARARLKVGVLFAVLDQRVVEGFVGVRRLAPDPDEQVGREALVERREQKPDERNVAPGVVHRVEQAERQPDLGRVEEIDLGLDRDRDPALRQGGAESERGFFGAQKDRDVVGRDRFAVRAVPLGRQADDLVGDPGALGVLGGRFAVLGHGVFEHPDDRQDRRGAARFGGFGKAKAVALDVADRSAGRAEEFVENGVREIDDRLVAAEVLGEKERGGGTVARFVQRRKRRFQPGEDARLRPAEEINALLDVSDEEAVALAGDRLEDRVLERIDVLVLVDEDLVVTRRDLARRRRFDELPRFGIARKKDPERRPLDVCKRRDVAPPLLGADQLVEATDQPGEQPRRFEVFLGFGFPVGGGEAEKRNELEDTRKQTVFILAPGQEPFQRSFEVRGRPLREGLRKTAFDRRNALFFRPEAQNDRAGVVVGGRGVGKGAGGGEELIKRRTDDRLRLEGFAVKVGKEVFDGIHRLRKAFGDPGDQRFPEHGLFGGEVANVLDISGANVEFIDALRAALHLLPNLQNDRRKVVLAAGLDDGRNEVAELLRRPDPGLFSREQAVDERVEHEAEQMRFLVRVADAVTRRDARAVGELGDDPAAETVDRADVGVGEQQKLVVETAVGGVLPDRLVQRPCQFVFEVACRRDGEGDDHHARNVARVGRVGQHPDHAFGQRGRFARPRRRREKERFVPRRDGAVLRFGPLNAALLRGGRGFHLVHGDLLSRFQISN